VTRYLLDTNILSSLFRNPDGAVDQALRGRIDQEVGTSLIVKGEVLFGLAKNNNLRGLRLFEGFLESLAVWPLEPPIEASYAELRVILERRGIQMGPNDLWIAAHAVTLEAVLVTDDRAFLSVPGLKVENWLRNVPADRE
jgi:tRNA(fMet)-specific endonuclease VapC